MMLQQQRTPKPQSMVSPPFVKEFLPIGEILVARRFRQRPAVEPFNMSTKFHRQGFTVERRTPKTTVKQHLKKDANQRRVAHKAVMSRLGRQGEPLSLGYVPGSDGGLTLPVLIRYLHILDTFWDYAVKEDRCTDDGEQLEAVLRDYANLLALSGEPPSKGDTLRAAPEASYPTLGQHGPYQLPLLTRTLDCWRRRVQNRMRLPAVQGAVVVLAYRSASKGNMEGALRLLLSFSAYLRPKECSPLRVDDLGSGPLETRTDHEATLPLSPLEQALASPRFALAQQQVLQAFRDTCEDMALKKIPRDILSNYAECKNLLPGLFLGG
jgi:hypothetical protein